MFSELKVSYLYSKAYVWKTSTQTTFKKQKYQEKGKRVKKSNHFCIEVQVSA